MKALICVKEIARTGLLKRQTTNLQHSIANQSCKINNAIDYHLDFFGTDERWIKKQTEKKPALIDSALGARKLSGH